MASNTRRSRVTDYKCSAGHEWYSWSATWCVSCPYPRCDGEVQAVKGFLAGKKEAGK